MAQEPQLLLRRQLNRGAYLCSRAYRVVDSYLLCARSRPLEELQGPAGLAAGYRFGSPRGEQEISTVSVGSTCSRHTGSHQALECYPPS